MAVADSILAVVCLEGDAVIDRETLANLLNEEDALVLPKHSEALIGIGNRGDEPSVAIYDKDLLIESFMEKGGCTYDEALEWVDWKLWDLDEGNMPMVIERVPGIWDL